jgi:hypothetical protein
MDCPHFEIPALTVKNHFAPKNRTQAVKDSKAVNRTATYKSAILPDDVFVGLSLEKPTGRWVKTWVYRK